MIGIGGGQVTRPGLLGTSGLATPQAIKINPRHKDLPVLRWLTIPAMAVSLISCSPGEESTASADKCAKNILPSYGPKKLDQCVAVCMQCNHGVPTTCSTSCNLKGAR
jgi:hypothetical protein